MFAPLIWCAPRAPYLIASAVIYTIAAVTAPPITGRVTDETGRPLANVDIVVTEVGRTTTTASDGTFELRGLPAGVYHLNILLIGFAPGHLAVTLPESGDPVQANVTLRAATVRLQSVQVTATPTGTDPLSVTQATAELSGKALNRNLGASIAQTLANEPGLAMRYNGPAATVPVIRGLTGERILVLQDGQRAGDLSSTSSDHGLTIDPLNAQRIEVVRGPASLLYGNNALGGVVNVISNDIPTQVPGHLAGYVATQGESVNPGGGISTGLSVPLAPNLVAAGRINMRSIDDFRAGGNVRQRNTYSRNQGGVFGAGFVGSTANGGAAYRGQRFSYGLPAAASDPELGGHIEGARNEGIARVDVNLNRGVLQTARLEGSAQWYHHDEVENTGEVGTRFDLQTQSANVTTRVLWAPGFKAAMGASGLFKQYAASGEEALTPAANSTTGGVFVYQEIPLRRPSPNDVNASAGTDERVPQLQIGARYDAYRIRSEEGDERFGAAGSRSFSNVSGSFGASTPVGRYVTVSGSVARAFRAPTVEELYSNGYHAAVGTYDIGSAALRPEINSGADVIVRAQSGRTSGQVAAYVNRIDDYITPSITRDTTIAEAGIVPLNVYRQEDATMRGIEGQVEAEVARHIVFGMVGDMVRGTFTSGSALPFLPAGRLGGSLRWDDGRFFAGGDMRHGFAQTRVSQTSCPRADLVQTTIEGDYPTDPTSGAPCVDIPVPAYTLVNLSVGITLNARGLSHSLTLRADNLGNTRYFDASSRIKSFTANPGRNLSLVYRLLY